LLKNKGKNQWAIVSFKAPVSENEIHGGSANALIGNNNFSVKRYCPNCYLAKSRILGIDPWREYPDPFQSL
jgi:hypothetical protein